jgi:hypothetical protein
MARFYKVPIIVEAQQYVKGGAEPFPDRTCVQTDSFRPYVVNMLGMKLFLNDGDWIVAEPDGEHFLVYRPDEFAKAYKAV